ncbi:amidohydrolase family protein [Tuwongella immobilis]|uniref:Amidohydrolase-related domain-containing protein n=1 Tax=Tuwongella immobilis TaxID=692036 RepID=A0A6C2YQA4_9BACT|nr:amidohydrolase family protein [Tuwongella immobilis]VIP03574.1 amidohydrolase : Putative TIM-barrel fold metal-dependent hydrolase OS=Singulisphaera acidiphila (strain ATCC BAA-1392 / DSM 18658 / VKM B-2454 / MOB10) GN=Sinac_0439 PE=4 SV=1: Amidohydro_2 [Tuwongella immobilis]VTS04516.1 amidohydrolase : Putative TIM-barrel fold metal-dependent hydrolase OS=Singulisphaera acidiphila (strain ATCC BAA-1392 / DSM 18658 / VKM B-2454 / MOB10) GN=Sinac_0439 PE=4 SV=1: Amidohydro_2 [Tuwongella immobili
MQTPESMRTRREFLAALAVGATAASLTGRALAESPADLPVLDAHVHIWNLKQFKLPWLTPDAPFAKDFTPENYRDAIAGTPTKASMYMEVDVAKEQKQAEADYIAKLVESKQSPFIAAIIGGNVVDAGFAKYAAQFKGSPSIKGIREVIHVPEKGPKYCLQPEFIAGVRELGKNGLTFDLCIRAVDMPNVIEMAKACPDTRLILDHCGNPNVQAADNSPWMKNMEQLAKLPNVAVKLSGILYTAKKGEWTPKDLAPIVQHTYHTFGPKRTIFASDWPVCTVGGTYLEWYKAVLEILAKEPIADLKRLLDTNARTWYGIA